MKGGLLVSEGHKKETDDEAIDFSKVKNKIKSFFRSAPKAEAHKKETDETVSVDLADIKKSLKKHARWIIPLICILIAMTVSVYFRTTPQRLPITDNWAEDSVQNFYRSQLQNQVEQQYPNLPQQNKEALIETQWQKHLAENKDTIDQQIEMLSDQYKQTFKDDQGTLYLLGIDPYYYYRQTQYVVENGYPGSSIKDGVIWDDYRLAPLGREGEWNLHNWFGAIWHKFLNLFGDFPLMYTFFFVGTIFSALTVIPGFFIGKRLTKNNAGGFFTAFLLAVSAFFVSRTTGESSDTDVYAVFFPVLITWFFLEALSAKERKWKFAWITTAGFATGLFAFAWTGWWYIATFLLVTMLFQLAYLAVIHRKTISQSIKSSLIIEPLSLLGIYVVSLSLFVSIFTTFSQFKRVVLGPFQFLRLKAVAVTSYWPNIRTTVAELNVTSLTNVIEQLGGKLLLMLGIAGILILLFKKDENGNRNPQLAFLIALWLAASLFATTKGMRFILQATPVFAIAVGAFLGLSWAYVSQWISKELKFNSTITKVLVFLLLALLLIQPAQSGYSQAFHSVSSMNDAWFNTLTKIKNEAPANAVITSWWDFGHWFKAVADRPVTFDGGTQTPWGAYWVGKSLLTNNEKTTVGILRMLNCGQNNAFVELDKIFNDTPKTIEILNQIILKDKAAALQTLKKEGLATEQIASVLQFTHCENPPPDYYIASEDMVGKAGVWGHFGSWDFRRAVIYQKIKNLEHNQAVAELTASFSLSPEEAEQYYNEVKTTSADSWIASWPGYLSGVENCEKIAEDQLRCLGSVQGKNFAVRVDLNDHNAAFENNAGDAGVTPTSIVYAGKQGIEEKEFKGETVGFSIILIPNNDNYYFIAAPPQQAASTFTKLYFFDGYGLDCFSKFDEVQNINGGKITTWIVDYACQQKN